MLIFSASLIGVGLAASPPIGTWLRGRGCVRATTRAGASAKAGRPPRAIPGCGQPSSRRRMPPVVQRTLTCPPSTADSLPVGARRELLWPLAILVIAYHLLQRSCGYEELGGDYFDKRDRQGVESRLVRRLEGLGYKVSLDPVAA